MNFRSFSTRWSGVELSPFSTTPKPTILPEADGLRQKSIMDAGLDYAAGTKPVSGSGDRPRGHPAVTGPSESPMPQRGCKESQWPPEEQCCRWRCVDRAHECATALFQGLSRDVDEWGSEACGSEACGAVSETLGPPLAGAVVAAETLAPPVFEALGPPLAIADVAAETSGPPVFETLAPPLAGAAVAAETLGPPVFETFAVFDKPLEMQKTKPAPAPPCCHDELAQDLLEPVRSICENLEGLCECGGARKGGTGAWCGGLSGLGCGIGVRTTRNSGRR